MNRQNSLTHSLTLIVFTLLLVILAGILFFSRYVVLISVIGLGIGTLLSPLLNYFHLRFRIPRVLSATIVLSLIFFLLGIVLYGLIDVVSDQLNTLTTRYPLIIRNLQDLLSRMGRRHPWMEQHLGEWDLVSALQTGLQHLYLGLQTGLLGIGGMSFALILGLYTAVNSREYFQALLQAFPARSRPRTQHLFLSIARTLRRWFRAQLIDMGIIGGVTALGLWLAGMDYWAVFGLVTAIFGIIPYVGIILVVICAALLTLASDPSKVPWVLGIFFLTQQLEGNVILPLVMKDQVSLPEVPLLIIMLLMGHWFGLVGIFLAPPFLAVLRTIYLLIYIPKVEAMQEPAKNFQDAKS